MEQLSPEWFAIRKGKVTAGRIVDVMAGGKGVTRQNYMNKLIDEVTTSEQPEGYTNAYMQWGIDQEPKARQLYELQTGYTVEQTGFVLHPTIEGTGASPDGLVGEDGLVEIKCPATSTHREFLLTGKIKTQYIYQMHWQMVCTERKWCDFVSYDPRMINPNLRLKIVRVPLDEELVSVITEAVVSFIDELNDNLKQLEEIGARNAV